MTKCPVNPGAHVEDFFELFPIRITLNYCIGVQDPCQNIRDLRRNSTKESYYAAIAEIPKSPGNILYGV